MDNLCDVDSNNFIVTHCYGGPKSIEKTFNIINIYQKKSYLCFKTNRYIALKLCSY